MKVLQTTLRSSGVSNPLPNNALQFTWFYRSYVVPPTTLRDEQGRRYDLTLHVRKWWCGKNHSLTCPGSVSEVTFFLDCNDHKKKI